MDQKSGSKNKNKKRSMKIRKKDGIRKGKKLENTDSPEKSRTVRKE